MDTSILSQIKSLDENFQVYIIMVIIGVICITFLIYMIRLSKLDKQECDYMNTLYPSVNGNLKSITAADDDCSGNLVDYYVKTAYNACSGGAYKNDFVDVCNLKAVIKQGVRCVDFEIYSIDNQPVVATSTSDNYHVKETLNSVSFATVMQIISSYAFSGGTCPNPSDPLLIHLRFKSNNPAMYENLSKIFKSYTSLMLGPNYSYEADGKNLGNVPLLKLANKVVLIIDRSNTTFLDNADLLEYVNITSNSIFMREYTYYDVKNNPDMNELTEFNKRGLSIIIPDSSSNGNPANPSGMACRAMGCQLVAMRYQQVDNFLMENATFFDRAGYAFVLKPAEFRYEVVTVPTPEKQLPEYSYATRNSSTDYYNFNF